MAPHYKDSLFRSIFNNEQAAREVYNAVHTTRYDAQTEVIINTLSETLWTGQKNDVSFLMDRKQVVLVEHQSTVNQNMPFRLLQPLVRLFEQRIPEKKAIYRERRIRLPWPEFLVFYNGVTPQPAVSIQYLSEAFEEVEGLGECNLELVVQVYNINYGINGDLLERSEHLKGYAYFVERARYYERAERGAGIGREERTLRAVRRAIADCQEQKLLSDFWESLTMEDIIMLSTEWDWNLALEVREEEGIEKGMEKGIGLGVKKRDAELLELINQGYTIEQLKERLAASVGNVQDWGLESRDGA